MQHQLEIFDLLPNCFACMGSRGLDERRTRLNDPLGPCDDNHCECKKCDREDRCTEQLANDGTFAHFREVPQAALAQQGVETHPGPDAEDNECSENNNNDTNSNTAKHDHEDIQAVANKFFTHNAHDHYIDIEKFPQCALIESQNCSSLDKHKADAYSRKAQVRLYQETSLDNNLLNQFRILFAGIGWDAIFSVCCPESTKPTAGVANMARSPSISIPIHPKTQAYKEAFATGRICITICTLDNRCTVYCIKIFGWTNGDADASMAGRTNSLIIIAKNELRAQPPLPTILKGDINAEPADIRALGELCHDGWTDLCLNAHWRGGTASQPTCQAHNATTLTRRDYAFASPSLLPLVAGFNVHWENIYTVHACMRVLIRLDGPPHCVKRNYKPISLANIVAEEIDNAMKEDESDDNDQVKRKNARNTVRENIKQRIGEHIGGTCTTFVKRRTPYAPIACGESSPNALKGASRISHVETTHVGKNGRTR